MKVRVHFTRTRREAGHYDLDVDSIEAALVVLKKFERPAGIVGLPIIWTPVDTLRVDIDRAEEVEPS